MANDEQAPGCRYARAHDPGGTRRVFWCLLAAALLAEVLIIPYTQTLLGVRLNAAVWVIGIIFDLIGTAVAIALGLWLGDKVGLGAPDLRAWLDDRG